MKVYNDDGSDNYKFDDILKKWVHDFKGVLNRPVEENDCYDNDFYNESVFTLRNKEMLMQENDVCEELNVDISKEEITAVLRKLKSGKSCGPDFLPNEILKKPQLSTLLHKLFQFCFNNKLVPAIWRKAIIVPIPKSAMKDPHVPLNYRGISLLNCTAKIYSAIINERLTKYCERNNILEEEQNGFRSKRSCQEHIFSLTSILRNKLGENNQVYTAFIDFHKAFDWIDRSLLFYKLSCNYGLKGKIYWAIKVLYDDTAACIRLNNNYSEWFITTSGVKQGDNLSPTLFSLFINDLAQDIKNLQCGVPFGENDMLSILLYADDIVLVSETEDNLQLMLNCMLKWCNKWRLAVNESKTKVIHVRPNRVSRTAYTFKLGEKELELVKSYKY
jgi:hypothetical protein